MMINTMNKDEIKALRVSMGLTQKQFAEKLIVSLFTVYRWEKGISKPNPIYQKKLFALRERNDKR